MAKECEHCQRPMRCIIGDFWLCKVCDKDENADEWHLKVPSRLGDSDTDDWNISRDEPTQPGVGAPAPYPGLATSTKSNMDWGVDDIDELFADLGDELDLVQVITRWIGGDKDVDCSCTSAGSSDGVCDHEFAWVLDPSLASCDQDGS